MRVIHCASTIKPLDWEEFRIGEQKGESKKESPSLVVSFSLSPAPSLHLPLFPILFFPPLIDDKYLTFPHTTLSPRYISSLQMRERYMQFVTISHLNLAYRRGSNEGSNYYLLNALLGESAGWGLVDAVEVRYRILLPKISPYSTLGREENLIV